MKRITGIILSVLLILSVIPLSFVAVADGEPTYDMTVYVSSSGNDGTGDGSQANPYASIATAEGVIEAASATNGRIIMLTNMTFTSAAHTKMITITGSTGSENLIQTGSTTSVNGPTTFKNFSINDQFKNITDGNEVIYEDIAVSGTKGMFYFGNSDSSITTPNNITINGLGSGVNNGVNVRIGPGTRQGIVNSDLNVVVNRGYFYQFWVHEGTYNGNVSFTFNGGVVYSSDPFLDPYTNYTTTYNGAYQVILNNGFSQSVSPSVGTISAAGGKWLMYGDTSGGALSTTATPGTFSVSSGFEATATNRTTGTEYTSVFGILTVPAGTYDVTYSLASSDSAVFYVSSSGSDSNTGLSDSAPLATISRAETVIEASGAQSGEIIMLTDMTFTSAAHTKMITITGATGAENLTKASGDPLSVNGPTTFKGFSVNDTFKNVTDGNEVVYEDIAVSGTKGMFYFGNSDSSITTPNNITINGLGSGVNNGVNVRVGPQTREGVVNSDINITVNSGYFNQFWVHEGTYNGNVSYTINGGTVYGGDPFIDPYDINEHVYNGAYQVILNNGILPSKISPTVESTVTAAGGKWLMYCDDSGGMLSTTATPGTFAVTSGFQATATNRTTGTEYTSADGALTVPAGSYDVTYENILLDNVVVYVSSSGSDDTGNGTSESPYATIAKAEQVIQSASTRAGEIVMLTDMTFTSAAHTMMITIRGATGAENLTKTSGDPVSVNGPTTFKDFNVNDTFKNATNGNEVVYDNISVNGTKGMFYFGNIDASVTTPNNITLNGLGSSTNNGVNIRVGPVTRKGVVNSDINITVNSGYFYQFWVHEGTYNGNVSYTINGGTIYGEDPFIDPYEISKHVYNGAYQVILNNGISPSRISPTVENTVTAAGGKWLMYGDDSGGMLSITDTPGTFAISGTSSAIARNLSTDAVYSSANGLLTVPAGKYSVSFGVAFNDTSTFYVSEGGDDANDGLTAATAFATIDRAEKWLGYSTADNKTIIVSGAVDFDGGEAHDDMITIRGDGTASLTYDTTGQYNSQIFGNIALKGPTTFENIILDSTKLVTNGYELVLGDDVEPVDSEDGYYYVGNLDNSASSTKSENITINSFDSNVWHGAFVRIGAFGNASGRAMGDVNVTFNGGRFRQLQFWQAVINGNANFVFNGGIASTVEGSEYSTSINANTVFNGAVQFIMNNGIGDEFLGDAFTSIDAADGVWYVYCNETAGGYLTTTEYAGLYTINGANYARAVKRDTGDVIYSYEGQLDLGAEPGTYDVVFYESIHFGDVNSDGELDICDLIAEKKALINSTDYIWAADVNEDLEIDYFDYREIVYHLLGVREISWEADSGISLIDASDLTFGGAESAAATKKATISSNSDTVKSVSGTKYYISPNGNDSNSGTSSSAPLKTIAKLNTKSLSSGTIVLFERGGVYRTEEALKIATGVKYGAYGTGAKPVISGSLKNYAEGTTWTTEDGSIWQTTLGKDDIGGVVFNDGESYGYRKFAVKELTNDGDYYYDTTDKVLYLLLNQHNPASYFDSIEISTTAHLVYDTDGRASVKIENLAFAHSKLTAVDFWGASSIEITGCEFAWIGGALDSQGLRYGNAIQFWNGINTATVSKCRFYQVYDAAITFQGKTNTANNYRSITIENNLIEYCSYNFEFWCGMRDPEGPATNAVMKDISVNNNIFRYSGYGFGKQRSATYSQAFILTYSFDPDNIATFSNFTISNNTFDCAKSFFFNAQNAYDDITFSNNTYYQKSDSHFPIVRDREDSGKCIVPTNQAEFAAEIAKVEASPALVSWIE